MKSGFIKFIIAMLVVAGLSQACYDGISHDVSESSVRKGRKLTTALTFAPMENEVDTKSLLGSRGEAVVYNWNLFVFEDGILVGKYYKEGQNGGPAGDIEFNVKLDYPYDFLAVANVGNRTGGFAPGATKAQVEAMTISNIDIASNGLPMSWSGSQRFTRAQYEANQAKLEVNMTRLVSKYEIVVNKSNLTVWSFEVTSLTMKGAGSVKPFSATGTNAGSSNSTVNDQATASDLVLMNGGSPAVFYPVENVFPTPSALSGNTDPWNKIPGNLDSEQFPSYIEMTATARLTDGTALPKTVTYRFYLGQDAMKDFNVIRNTSNKITFSPDDETIKNGRPGGNWKIEPGPFSDSRTLCFERQTSTTSMYRIKAGTSTTEGIIHTPSDFKYYITTGSSHITMRNPSTNAVITSGSLIDLSSVKLDIQNGIEEQTTVHLQTMDGAKYDDLYLDIYNAYLDIIDPIPPARNWVWNAAGSGTAQTFTVATSIDFTMDVPTGWTANKSLVSDINGEKTWTITVYPNDPSTVTTAPGESLPLKFKTTELDDVVATLTRDFKPLVLSDGNTSASLEWAWNEATSTGAKALSISSNEEWVIVWPDGDHSHWTVSPASGAKTVTSISVYPADINDSTNPVSATFYVVPVRGGVNVDAGKLTVNLNHKANLPYINVSGSDLDEGALKWLWYQNGPKSINVTSNIGWTASLDNDAAASFNISSNAGTVTVTPKNFNYDASGATGNVVLRGTGDFASTVQNIPVSQSRYPSIAVSPDAGSWLATAYDARPFTVTITAAAGETYQWAGSVANNPANTVNFSMSPASGNNSTSFTAAPASANGSSTQGNAAIVTITLAGDYGSATKPTFSVNLSQASAAPFISISPDVSSLGWHWYEGTSSARKQIEVTTNVADWEIALEGTNASKFYCDYNSSNPNIIDIYPVNINDGAAISGVTLVIRSTDSGQSALTKNISLSQTKAPSISVNPAQLDWPWDTPSTQTSAVTIDADESYTWSAALTDGSSYFSLSNATGSSGSSFSVTRSENNNDTEHDLTGTVRVSLAGEMGGQTKYVDVPLRQVKKTAFTLSVAPSYLTFAASANGEGSKQMITVTSNTSWSVTCPTGYSASTSGGSGDGSFYVWPTSTSSTYTQDSYIANGYVQVSGTGVSTQQVQMRRTSVSPFSHYELAVEGGGETGHTGYDNIDFEAQIIAVYENSYREVCDYASTANLDITKPSVDGYGTWISSAWGTILASQMPTSTDDLSGTVTMQYKVYDDYDLYGATASAGFKILGRPHIVIDTPLNFDYSESGYTSSKSYIVSMNRPNEERSWEYAGGDGSSLFGIGVYSNGSAYPIYPNTSTSPRTARYTISFTHFPAINATLELTQGGAPAGPTYYTYYAAQLSTYLSSYDVEVGSKVTASATFTVRSYTTTSTTPSSDWNDYTIDVSNTPVTSVGFNTDDSNIASVNGSTITGVSPGNTVISSKYSFNTSDYDYVDYDPAPLTVSAPTPTTIYKVVTNADPDELYVGESTSLSATLYSSTNGGSSWSVESTSPNSYSKVGGTSVINTSTGQATTAGSGVYRGIFNDYTISDNEDATVTVNAPVLESISLNKSSYLLNYANMWHENFTVTAHYSNGHNPVVTPEATVTTLPTGILIDPISGTINCSAVVSNQEFEVSYGGQTTSAQVTSVDSWFLQGLEVSGLEGSTSTGSQFNFKIQGSYIKVLTLEGGQYQTIHQEANAIDGALSYINIEWNGSDEYEVSFKGYTQIGQTRSVSLKYINPKEPGWEDNYIVITLNFEKKTNTSWTYTGFTTDENPIDMEF